MAVHFIAIQLGLTNYKTLHYLYDNLILHETNMHMYEMLSPDCGSCLGWIYRSFSLDFLCLAHAGRRSFRSRDIIFSFTPTLRFSPNFRSMDDSKFHNVSIELGQHETGGSPVHETYSRFTLQENIFSLVFMK